MFEHLDDPSSHRTGSTPQLAAVRNRARQISSERRRNKLALGSVTVAATAVVSGAAAAGSLIGSGSATGQVGSGTTASADAAKASKLAGANAPDPSAGPGDKPTEPGVTKSLDPSADAAKASKLAGDGLTPVDGPAASMPPKPVCDTALPSLAGLAAPSGYSIVDTPSQVWAEYTAGGATVTIKVTCSPEESADKMAKDDGWTVGDAQVAGHTAFQWSGKNSDIGVGWSTRSGAIYIQAAGPAAARLTLAQLEAFAATVPTA
jgi:hypothetical protein